jgi:hypothetical protein
VASMALCDPYRGLASVSCTLRRLSSRNRAKNRNDGAVKHVRRFTCLL